MDLFSQKPAVSPARTQAVRERVIEALALDHDAVVMVTELACQDDECPDVEVVIAVLRQGRSKLQVKIDSSISDMDDAATSEACRLLKADDVGQLGSAEVLA